MIILFYFMSFLDRCVYLPDTGRWVFVAVANRCGQREYLERVDAWSPA